MKLIPALITLTIVVSLGYAQTPKSQNENTNGVIKPVEGGITIAELFANRDNYANKVLIMRGKVTKFNSNIMGKNWIHIQDGTEYSGENDLTITSDMEVKVDDIVAFEGKITLDKDIGPGYFYKIIMEDAKIVE